MMGKENEYVVWFSLGMGWLVDETKRGGGREAGGILGWI